MLELLQLGTVGLGLVAFAVALYAASKFLFQKHSLGKAWGFQILHETYAHLVATLFALFSYIGGPP